MKKMILSMSLMVMTSVSFANGGGTVGSNISSTESVVNLCGEKVQFKNIEAAGSSSNSRALIGQIASDMREFDDVSRVVVCYQNDVTYIIGIPQNGSSYALSVVEK